MTLYLPSHKVHYCLFRAFIVEKNSKTHLAFCSPHCSKSSGRDATAALYCPTSVENLITTSLFLDGVETVAKHNAPSGALNNCLLAPHRGPVQLNSDIFLSVYYSEVPPVEQRAFRGRVARSGSWLGPRHKAVTVWNHRRLQASQECVHELICWERTLCCPAISL